MKKENEFIDALNYAASDEAQRQALQFLDDEIEADERAVAIYEELDKWMSEPDRSHLQIVK